MYFLFSKIMLQESGNNWGNNFSPIPEDWNNNREII
jgi:hypothetical protein